MKFLINSIYSKIILISALLFVTVLFIPNDVYANHLSQDMKWQLVYISHNNACSNYDIQMTRTFSEITSGYLTLYQLENTKYESFCVNQYEYSDYIAPFDLDLLILVYDKDIGRSELNALKIGGLYHHTGSDNLQKHAIIVCDCPTFNFSSPMWILTHELSHFVLTYLGNDMTTIEDMVHTNDAAYDKCIASRSSCGSLVMKIRSETSAYSYSVMPVYTPAIGMSILDNSEEELPTQVVELSKIITKWWTQEKISDGDFFNALGFMATGNSLFTHMNPKIITADTAFDSDNLVEKLLSSESEEITSTLLSRIPKSLLSNDELLFDEDNKLGMPSWFETIAKWWIEGKISDEEFKKNVNFLRNEGLIRPQ
jgi:hypothetical protein